MFQTNYAVKQTEGFSVDVRWKMANFWCAKRCAPASFLALFWSEVKKIVYLTKFPGGQFSFWLCSHFSWKNSFKDTIIEFRCPESYETIFFLDSLLYLMEKYRNIYRGTKRRKGNQFSSAQRCVIAV